MKTDETFEDAWAAYHRGIRAFVFSKVANPADAEDLVQDISLKMFRNLHTLQVDQSIRSWMYQIANRTIIDFYRGDRSRLHDPLDTEPGGPVADDRDVKELLAPCVAPFINTLPDEAKALLTAIDLEGRSQKEYAVERGIKYSTLKSRVKSSRAALKKAFEQCCRFIYDSRGNLSGYQEAPDDCRLC